MSAQPASSTASTQANVRNVTFALRVAFAPRTRANPF
jgi:hypothetical protein